MVQMIEEKRSLSIPKDVNKKQTLQLSKRERELQWILHGGKKTE